MCPTWTTPGGRGGSSHANPREPINILLAKGPQASDPGGDPAAHGRRAHGPGRRHPAAGLPVKKQREEFSALAGELQRIKIIGNVDAGELARYVVAHGFYARYTKLLRTLPKKKRARLRELRARLAAEEGRAVAAGEEIDDEDVALELERSLALPPGQVFHPVRGHGPGPGLNITSRCKLVIPQEPPVPKSNKFDRFKKLAEGE